MAKKKKKEKKKEYNPISYTQAQAPASAPAAFTPGTYVSQYGDQLNSALQKITNWSYDPMQDANYQALAKVYGARGNQAAQDTLGEAAALNGGLQSSYAVSAAQQARNQYNQELAALIPELEQNAFNKAQTTYNALMDADESAYGRFRDTEGDRKWQYEQAYGAYRDAVADYQWGKGYDTDIYQYKQQQKKSSGGGGGGGRRSGGGGGYYGGGSTSSGMTAEDLLNAAKNYDDKKKKYTVTKNTKAGGYTSYGGNKGGRIVK